MTASEAASNDLLSSYDAGKFFDELFSGRESGSAQVALIRERLGRLTFEDLRRRSQDAERELYNLGITFLVYSV